MARRHFIAASVLLLAGAGNAWGETALSRPSNRTAHWEFSIQTRYVDAQEFDGKNGSSVSTEDDLGWGFNVAYNFNERFNVGWFASWRSVGYDAHIRDAEDTTTVAAYSGWLDTAQLAFNGTWNVLPKRFTPYLQGSIGWSMIDTNIPSGIDIGCWWDPWWGYVCAGTATTYGDDALAATLGAGASAQITDNFYVRAGYEKLWVDADMADDFNVVRLDMGFMYR